MAPLSLINICLAVWLGRRPFIRKHRKVSETRNICLIVRVIARTSTKVGCIDLEIRFKQGLGLTPRCCIAVFSKKAFWVKELFALICLICLNQRQLDWVLCVFLTEKIKIFP